MEAEAVVEVAAEAHSSSQPVISPKALPAQLSRSAAVTVEGVAAADAAAATPEAVSSQPGSLPEP